MFSEGLLVGLGIAAETTVLLVNDHFNRFKPSPAQIRSETRRLFLR